MIDAIISGGQTGADQGGLFAAKELGIPTSGYAPKGWRTEDGPAPWLADYELMEHESRDYEDRTLANIKLADATVIFGRRSRGSNLTENLCGRMRKHCAWVMWTPDIVPGSPTTLENWTYVIPSNLYALLRVWIGKKGIKILNVAGNRESKNTGIREFTTDFLIKALR